MLVQWTNWSMSESRDHGMNSADVAGRLQRHAQTAWPDCGEIVVRQRGQYVYVSVRADQDSVDPLCRLRYTGSGDLWEFGYHSHASGKYEISMLPSGRPYGTPEECFDCAAQTHVQGGDEDDDFEAWLRGHSVSESTS